MSLDDEPISADDEDPADVAEPESFIPPVLATEPEPDSADEPNEEQDEEEPEASTVHPSAAAGTTEETFAVGRAEHGQYFIGMWGEHPNFGCPFCSYASLDLAGDIELHILSMIESGDLNHMAALELKGE